MTKWTILHLLVEPTWSLLVLCLHYMQGVEVSGSIEGFQDSAFILLLIQSTWRRGPSNKGESYARLSAAWVSLQFSTRPQSLEAAMKSAIGRELLGTGPSRPGEFWVGRHASPVGVC